MKKLLSLFFWSLLIVSCKSTPEENITEPAVVWEAYDETSELEEQALHENERLQFELINSKYLDKNTIWNHFESDLAQFGQEKYNSLKPLILEKDVPTLQRSIKAGDLTYTDLSLFYIYRIRELESNNDISLNAVIALNPNVVEEARELDKKPKNEIDIYAAEGMPVLLKDNINTAEMRTTAGAIALVENQPEADAFIVERLKEKNVLILGKVNLSEWAYYFCDGCPLGYSAVGGQTLNPYGRKKFETGGSSAGSGVAVAANYAVAAVGTETAGSILSPSSQNSVVGLKPTVGLLSRSGIVPISSTLDTPGPMTRSVVDNAIFLAAMTGVDPRDEASVADRKNYLQALAGASLEGSRVGVIRSLLRDSLYNAAVQDIRDEGGIIVEFDPPEVGLDRFSTLLDVDMKHDLPAYLKSSAGKELQVTNIKDIVSFNLEDSLVRAPYGQGLFDGILEDTTTAEELEILKVNLEESGRKYFDEPMDQHELDVILSINNYHAAYAAVAKYPALTVPMGYTETGEPKNLTFIARPFEEEKLLQLGYAFEQETRHRKIPANYQ